MIDLHMHTFWSDGVLIPAELVQRAKEKGLRVMAITDHVDHSNVDVVVPGVARFVSQMKGHLDIIVIPGMEITHVPPETIAGLAKKGRQLGARWIVVHGESPVEPVPKGTNRAAIAAKVDLLAHPGLITAEDVKLAAKKGVALEITTRKGHSLGNGHVARLGKRHGAGLILNTDTHSPNDMIDVAFARTVALGAGLTDKDFKRMQSLSEALAKKAMKARRKK